MTDKEYIEKLQQEIIAIKKSMMLPLATLETYWEFIPNSHGITCRESFPEAFILTGLEEVGDD
ncbi:MAG: hypothetical protein ACXQS5_06305 [Candidatus Methanospirareceae archaeon]